MGIMSFKQQINTRGIGVIVGAVVPIISIIIYWLVAHDDKTFLEWLKFLQANEDMRSDGLTFALLPNLLLFYLSNFRWRLDHFTVGLVGSTLILSVVVISLIVL